jgi:hypothetical protein
MVRRSVFPWTIATLALLGIRVASATPINFTGSVAQDFNPNTNPAVQTFTIDTNPANNIYQTPYMLQNNQVTGWAVKDLRLAYDVHNNTMSVGVNTYGIAGDADGNGNPGTVNPNDPGFMHGLDQPSLGGQKSITVAFAANNPGNPTAPGTPVVVAGVPADKATAGSGTDGFNVASYKGVSAGIQNNYGPTLANNMGTLAFDPSAAHPNLEFTITNFNQIPGLDPAAGFWIKVYSGSPDDGSVGEENTQWIRVPKFSPETIPEPSTVLTWTLLAGGCAVLRRRSKSR